MKVATEFSHKGVVNVKLAVGNNTFTVSVQVLVQPVEDVTVSVITYVPDAVTVNAVALVALGVNVPLGDTLHK